MAANGLCGHCGKDGPHRCKQCKAVWYCSKQCQQAHWKSGHKSDCAKLAKRCSSSSSGSETPFTNGAAADAVAEVKNNALPLPQQMIVSNEEFRQLVEEAPQRSTPVGLSNPANTCFANSLLQALLATPAMAAFLLSHRHSEGCMAAGLCMVCELEKLAVQVFAASKGGGGAVSPKPLLQHIRRLGKQFTFGRQEDAQELFVQLLDTLERAELEAAGGRQRFNAHERMTCVVGHCFGSYLRNQVQCLEGGHVSKSYEPHMGLLLEVSPRTPTLETALQQLCAPERLDGENKYQCDSCKARVPADKRMLLEVAPNVLHITLKRYTFSRFSSKVSSPCQFREQLDLSPFLAPDALDNQPAGYSLYGVVCHSGRSTDWGHYIAYVKVGGSWFLCNDACVSKVALTHVLNASAYMLFYQRNAIRDIPTKPRAAAAAEAESSAAVVPEAQRAEVQAAAGSKEQQRQQMSGSTALEQQQQHGQLAAAEVPAQPTLLSRIQTAPGSLDAEHVQALANGHAHHALGARSGSSLSMQSSDSSTAPPIAGESAPPDAQQPLHPSVSESNLREPASSSSDSRKADGFVHHQAVPAAADIGSAPEHNGAEREGGDDSSSESSLGPSVNPFSLLSIENGAAWEQSPAETGAAAAAAVRGEQGATSCASAAAEQALTLQEAHVTAGQQPDATVHLKVVAAAEKATVAESGAEHEPLREAASASRLCVSADLESKASEPAPPTAVTARALVANGSSAADVVVNADAAPCGTGSLPAQETAVPAYVPGTSAELEQKPAPHTSGRFVNGSFANGHAAASIQSSGSGGSSSSSSSRDNDALPDASAGSCSSMDSGRSPRSPRYVMEQQQSTSGTAVLSFMIQLPGASSTPVLSVEQHGRRQQLLVHDGLRVALALPLPVRVVPAPLWQHWRNGKLAATFALQTK